MKGTSPGVKRPRPVSSLSQPTRVSKQSRKKNMDVSMTPDTFNRSQACKTKKAVKRRSFNDTYRNDQKNFANYTQLTMSEGDDSQMDVDCDETPATLSQISAIDPPADDTLTTTFAPKKKRKSAAADETFEMAVYNARGEPDGAENDRSFTRKTLSKISLEDDNDGDESPEEEGFSEDEYATPIKKSKVTPSPKDKKKSPSLKVQKKSSVMLPLKEKAKKLKSLKSREGKTKETGKQFDALPDETTVPKTPNQTWKERKKDRKMVKSNYELISTAKKSWEELRRGDLEPAKRKKICDDLMELVSGKVKELSVVHDSSRVVQCLVQYGTEEQRVSMFEELKADIPELCKSKYSKFVIRKLIHYGSKDLKAEVLSSFRGHVRKLVKHKEASEIIEYAYNDFATAPQRAAILEEFYGPSFALFKEHSAQSLDQLMTQMPEKKEIVLRNMKEILLSTIDKELLMHSVLHKVFSDFFTYADDKAKKEVVEALRDYIPPLLHTRDGARVAMHCIWSGSVKDRKVIIKSLKTHVVKICKEEHGHMFLLVLFDCVDDTKLMQKVVIEEIVKSLNDVVNDQHGRKVLQYLLCPRDSAHFHPDIVKILSHGDGNPASKKETAIRTKELKTYISPYLINYLKDNTAAMMKNNNMALLVKAVMTNAVGDLRPAMIAIADFIAQPATDGEMSMVEHPACHIAMKKIIANDKVRMESGDGILFSSILLESLPKSSIKMWAASNRGCFMLLSLLEVNCSTITEKVTAQLKPVQKSLSKVAFKGAELLLEKLNNPNGKPKEYRV